MRPPLLSLLLLLLTSAIPTSASAPARQASVAGQGYGARVTLSVPKTSYRRDWYIDAAVRVRNISRRAIYLNGYPQTCWRKEYNGNNPIVQELTRKGRTVYPPRLKRTIPCRPPHRFRVPPRRSVRQLIYAPARAPYLVASVLLQTKGRYGRWRTVRVKTHRLHITVH